MTAGALRAALARPARLASARDHGLTRPLDDAEVDALVALLAEACAAPAAMLTVPLPGRVVVAAGVGVEPGVCDQPDVLAPCAHVVATETPLVVPDLSADRRFASSPLRAAGIVSYAGTPVRDSAGVVLGSLGVLDTVPRELSTGRRRLLEGLATQAGSLLTLRRRTRLLAAAAAERREQAVRLERTAEAQRHDALRLATQSRVLGLVAGGAPLEVALEALAHDVEETAAGVRCSVLVLDPEHGVLREGAAPSLPAEYRAAVDGVPVHDGSGACGTAAATGGECLTADVTTDPRWTPYADVARRAGIGAVWSSPITGSEGSVLGTFALYYAPGSLPSAEHRDLVATWTHLAGVAIERELAQRRLEHVARHDAVTGLPNRRVVFESVEAALGSPRHDGAVRTVAVLVLDLDRFKVLNDSLGHSVGDRYLAALAARLRERLAEVAPPAVLARLGGDEFAVVLPSADTHEALAVASAVVGAFATPVTVAGRPVRLSGSVGVALAGDVDGRPTAEGLLRDADAAMYEAKRRGHGQVEVFTGRLRSAALNRMEMEVALRHALTAGEIGVVYQPEYRLGSGALAGVEALARWTRADGTAVSPAEFIPVAEDSGLIVELGELVLRQACAQGARWRREHPSFADAHTWVNLSACQLEREDLPALVTGVLAETGLPATRLGLEVTESAVVADLRGARARLAALKALGIRIAIDDFGTGYSSLAQLIDLPTDVLKVDRSFVSRLPGAAGSRVVAAIVQLAHALGLSVIAEGVETAQQVEALRALGCDKAQGYHLGRPATADAVDALLHRLDGNPTALDAAA